MLGQDLRYALRLLAGNPSFAVVALLTMALGIGANTAIFSVIDTVLLRPAPVEDIDALAVVWETDRNTSTTREPASLPDYLDYQQRSQRVSAIAAFAGSEVNYMPEAGEAIRLQALSVTDELLPMLGVRPLAGRGFTAEEARAGGPAVAVISEGLWTRAFGRDVSVVGRASAITAVCCADRRRVMFGLHNKFLGSGRPSDRSATSSSYVVMWKAFRRSETASRSQ
jgi:putative ABC transport system permease protein